MTGQPDLGEIPITITAEPGGEFKGVLIRYRAPKVVEYLVSKLPIKQRIKIYKDNQVFISVGLKSGLEKPVDQVVAGDIAYWPVGDALCFYRNEMHPYSKVSVIGKVVDGLEILQAIEPGAIINIHRS